MSATPTPALLVLEDGRTFHGEAYGAEGETFGEAVFNTGMTGYQETLTDPSYHRQVVVMTAPHVGNTGMNDEDPESKRIWVAGYVVRDPARMPSNWRSQRSLDDELRAQGVVGISGIDTRALTRHLRERGAMRVGISSTETDPESLLERVRSSAAMAGANLSEAVSTGAAYVVPALRGPWGEKRFTVAALDLGIKDMTPQRMSERGIEVQEALDGQAMLARESLERRVELVVVAQQVGDASAWRHLWRELVHDAHDVVRVCGQGMCVAEVDEHAVQPGPDDRFHHLLDGLATFVDADLAVVLQPQQARLCVDRELVGHW